ncbi:4-hydroxy-tetrahydrodipicolinate reductase [Egibacter rhizosphaerae]|uniref:4-hydroxy-tetrahydrodipicolinate reductase n=2 Tax=Egibacter rhizosphaerae TaxID=1670831 RepID=A0A411YL37_9ACTN|nr:4-hydroxy-tetrahydrodipicolinate reductase [Egibacter rhizosphaerae]
MGSVTCAAVDDDPDCELVARIDATDGLDAALDAGADVAVEFTTPATVAGNASWLLERGVHVVVGATGLTDDDLTDLERRTGPANCIVAPNFAIGAVLMMRAASEIARHLPDVEVIEAHHPGKLDAPSGTAARTARLVAEARDADGATHVASAPDPTRGGNVDGVPVHAIRLPGVVASQEVLFGATGQTVSVRHDTLDRTAFMPGVLLAVKRVAHHDGLTVGLDALL